MNSTKKEVENAILKIAAEYNQEKNFFLMMKEVGLPKCVESIIYQMFWKEFDSRSCSDELHSSYKIILEFTKELQTKGCVEFK